MTLKKTLIIISFCVFTVLTCGYILMRIYSIRDNKIIPVKIANQIFYAEVVSDSQKMQKGLGGREGICEKCAMLFEFSKPGKYAFWMREMKFPIDILWILDYKIVHIEKNVPADSMKNFISSGDADAVLELAAGSVDKNLFLLGDNIEY